MKVPEALITHAVDTIALQSLDDFVNLVTINGYETELKTVLVDTCAQTKDDQLVLARARAG